MNSLFVLVQRYPLAAFFGLVFVLEWAVALLSLSSPTLLPFLLTFLPAIAAFFVVRISEGSEGSRNLLRKLAIWRAGVRWYVAAVGLPVLVGLISIGLALLLGSTTATQIGAFAAFRLMFFVFAAGEELGWRGYALPKLQMRYGALGASLLLGTLWFIFHLPLYLPGQTFAAPQVEPYLLMFVATSIVYTWLLNHTNGSVLMASLLHGSMNASGFLYTGMDAAWGWWLMALVWILVAVVLIVATRGYLGWTSTVREDSIHLHMKGAGS